MAKQIATTKGRTTSTALFRAVRLLIDETRATLSVTVNQHLTQLYWSIGKLIKSEILKNKRADYGEQIIEKLAEKLSAEYGKGWSKQQLWNCLYSVETIPNEKILSTLSRELSWSHIKELVYLKDAVQRDFYTQMCIHEKWSVRQLRERIDSMLFERTAISKKPKKLIKQELQAFKKNKDASPDTFFRDPYILDFLGLKDTFSERDLESSIIAELQRFIIELGNDFAFLGRQKRIQIEGEDYYIDLLFFHRHLQRLVAIDLKLGRFKPAYKAQMELYLNWLNKHERKSNEQAPLGLILCADKNDEHIELLELDKGNIRVAQYYTMLPAKGLLQKKLHVAYSEAEKKHKEPVKKIKKTSSKKRS